MNVNVQSIKFDADKKLIDFVEKKASKLDKFFDGIIGTDVFLRLDNQSMDNKKVEIRLNIPGNDLFAERSSKSFEESVDLCVDALKIQLQKAKEKMRGV
ncbi:MAG: ribosome-associated translation inhibitor RaiA [Prevotellaceae bacterium]|jgi:ribosomal subunit interface protein|nr:ribosome-associated translation inhibitor RaiA [Prevotellaceae bacterium]